ncbi:MAG: F0F1 ATP synthase subunit B family protein [Terriglobales bacterium]
MARVLHLRIPRRTAVGALLLLGLCLAAWSSPALALQTEAATVTPSATKPESAASAPATPAADAPEKGDVRNISLWLDGVARRSHIPRETLWTLVMAINAVILFYALYVVLYRMKGFSLPGMMRERSAGIQQGMADADRAYSAAAARLRELEARLAGLDAEIAQLHAQAGIEGEQEYQRLVAESRAEVEKVARLGQHEIEAAAQTARAGLKAFAAELALTTAERQIRERLTPALEHEVVAASIAELGRGGQQ